MFSTEFEGNVLMMDSVRDTLGVALKSLGYSMNSSSEDELREAADKLIEQKPLVQAYVMDQIYDKMERGEAWIAPYYAGDYLMMVEENEDLRFCFPEEGFNFFIDALCIPTCATNKEGAEAYINFLCSPEVNGENLDYLGYSTPESAAKEYMDPETAASDIAYPSEETLSRGEAFLYLDQKTTHLMDSLWLEVKTEGETDYTPIIGISATVLLAAVYLTARGVRDRRRRANRCKKWKT